jgi:hypothetical protein
MSLIQVDFFSWQQCCLECSQEYVRWGVTFRLINLRELRRDPGNNVSFCSQKCQIEWSRAYATRKDQIASYVQKWG